MDELVYPRERTLGAITLVLGLLVWLLLVVGTFGGALVGVLVGFVIYLFAQSALIAHIRGNGVELTDRQFPDLHGHFQACCERLQIKAVPAAYVMNGNGSLNAFATKFLGAPFVVLHSDIIDAMHGNPDSVRFYIGHELGHLRRRHLSGHLWRWPVLWLPLLGAAYSRARESTCDRHGAACCTSAAHAGHALAALAAGRKRWAKIDTGAYLLQGTRKPGFWMSFHELIGGYPWISKRFARVYRPDEQLPKRNGFAYLPALFVPFAGRLGGGFGFLILVYIVGVLAAIAIPAYKDYTVRAQLQGVVAESGPTRDALAHYYETTGQVPDSFETAGATPALPDGLPMTLDPKSMVMTVKTARGELLFVPRVDAGHVAWRCINGDGLKKQQLPASCRGP